MLNSNRRQFLQQLGLLSCVSALPVPALAAAQPSLWLSAATSAEGDGMALFGSAGQREVIATGFRGHGLCLSPDGRRAVMMARRPGLEGVELQASGNERVRQFHSRPDRQFQGHACYSGDGKRLFTSETVISDNPLEHGLGRIGIRDADTFEWLGDMSSGGVEPHELRLMPDQRTLVIANGGLRPSPVDGRESIDGEHMQSSLVMLDSISGDIVSTDTLSESKASIRHLDIAADGTVVVALQVQRQWLNDSDVRALVAVKRPGQSLETLPAPENLWLALDDYMGSVVVHRDLNIAGVTSPRGNLAVFWALTEGQLLGYFPLHDVCGIGLTPDGQHFVLTNSAGDIRYIDPVTLQENKTMRQHTAGVRWDNHLSSPLPAAFIRT